MGTLLLLFDGECRFCAAGSARLAALARPGAIERVDLHDRARLARYPHASQNPDASTLRLVRPDGRTAEGAEAVALALSTRRLWRVLTWLYWLPVVRQILDGLYRFTARHRFRIMGRTEGCGGGACRRGVSPSPLRPRGDGRAARPRGR